MRKIWLCLPVAFCMAGVLTFAACEQPVTDGDDGSDGGDQQMEGGIKVEFNVCNVEMMPFGDGMYSARNVTDVSKVCTRLELAVFDGDNRVAIVRQAKDDSGFGHVTVALAEGEYTVVVIAHNGDGAATITSPEEIKFKDNKVTDTFYYCGDITVGGESSYDLTLGRAVAMVRLVVEDNVPAAVNRMKFYYTGGSSTFDAVSGYGCVNSRQTEVRDVPAAAHSEPSAYEIYTFPHSDGRSLDITVTALNSSDGVVDEREFDDVPVERNQVTQYSGVFFGASPGSGRSFTFTVDDEWSQVDYEY